MGQPLRRFSTANSASVYSDDLSSEDVIIQCPSCQTKFKLDRKELEKVDRPKFHCSRCDVLFSADTAKRAKPAPSSSPEVRPQVVSKSPAFLDELPERARSFIEKAAPEKTSGGQLTFDFNDQKPTDMRAIGAEETVVMPDESWAGFKTETEEPPLAWSSARESPATETSEQTEVKVAAPPDSTVEMDFSRYAENFSKSQQAAEEENYQKAFSFAAAKPMVTYGMAGGARRTAPQRSPAATLAILLSPLLLITALLCAITLYARSSLSNGEKVLTWMDPSAWRAAPVGVFIKSTRLEQVTLDSGDKVLVIYGSALNNSDSDIRGLKFEAVVFDKLGAPIASRVAAAGNDLAEAVVKSLSVAELKAMQQDEPPKGYLLKKSKEQKFAIILDGAGSGSELAKSVKFFTARVHSARY